MAKQKAENFAQKSVPELLEAVKSFRGELLKLKLEHSKKQLKHTSSMTTIRKKIARALTALNEKKGVTEVN